MPSVTLTDMLACLDCEIVVRRNVCRELVCRGHILREVADREIGEMTAVRDTLTEFASLAARLAAAHWTLHSLDHEPPFTADELAAERAAQREIPDATRALTVLVERIKAAS